MFHVFKGAKYYLILSLSILVASMPTKSHAAFESTSSSQSLRTALVVAGTVLVTSWIRLKSKETERYMHYTWENDWKGLVKVWNMFTPTYWKLVDKYCIGRELALYDVNYTEERNGSLIRIKDKEIKSTPFGLMGLFDAYVLRPFVKLVDTLGKISDIEKSTGAFINISKRVANV